MIYLKTDIFNLPNYCEVPDTNKGSEYLLMRSSSCSSSIGFNRIAVQFFSI